MNTFYISDVSKIYLCGKGTTLKWHSVQYPEFHVFAALIDQLNGSLGDSSKDQFWTPIIRKLKKLRFDFCAAPFSEQLMRALLSDSLAGLKQYQEPCQQMYPNSIKQLSFLINQIDVLLSNKLPNLLDTFIELIGEYKDDVGLLIRESRLIPSVEESIRVYPNLLSVSVINSSLLQEGFCYKKLYVIGPSRWFPKYIFSAPRAPEITIVKYSWIKDSWKKEYVFTEPLKQKVSKNEDIVFQENEDTSIAPEDLLPLDFDFQRIADKVAFETHDIENPFDLVEARIYLLEGSSAVFLEADEKSSVLVIDLNTGNDDPVKRIKISDLRPGIFVLLRTGGGGDFILPVAEQIMGKNAAMAKEFQKEWKLHLQSLAKQYGFEHVVSRLLELGSPRATPMNVHNWMSERNIKPEYIEDFRAILRMINLEKEIETYWEMMKRIERSHIMAGQQIRRMLLKQVAESDLNSLKKNGVMEFTIPGENNVSITAFQVREISPTTVTVAPYRIGSPFEPED